MSKILIEAIERVIEERERRAKADAYFNDPAAWAEYMLGMRLWSKQAEIGQSVVHHKSVAVKAAHGVGKSFLAAVLICWWIDTRYPNAFVASTAPSQKQIGAIVWREVRKMKALITKRYKEGIIDHELPGYITADNEWKVDGGVILGFGRKPPENKEDDAFQGIHAAYVLAIGDEAVGLTEEIIDALGNITSNEGSRRFLICNPTNPASYVGKLFQENKSNWTFHTISAFDSPNFTDERHSMSPEALQELVDESYVREKKLEYGEDSARYKSRVLGEFAFDDTMALITPEVIERAKSTEIVPDSTIRPVLGVDVSRFGDDWNVVYENVGGVIRFVDKWQKVETTETAMRVHRLATDLGAGVVFVDSDGVGGGVRDQLVLLSQGLYTVVEVHGSGASPDRRNWHNFRAFAWDRFRARCLQGELDLDPDDTDLHDELMGPQYTFNKQSGGLVIESKDDMKKRGLKSPNLADSAIYCSIEFDVNDPLAGLSKGDKLRMTPEEMVGSVPRYIEVMRTI